MMKTQKRPFAAGLLVLAFTVPTAFGRSATGQSVPQSGEPSGFRNMTFALFGGSYSNPSPDFKDIYGGRTAVQFGLNLTRTLLRVGGFQVDATFELRTLSKSGKSTVSAEDTMLSLTPISVGGRLLYQMKYVMPYLGFGADFYRYDEKSSLADTSGTANGAHFQAGLYVLVPKFDFLRLKFFYKYTKVTAAAKAFEVGLGGPEYGLGLAVGFNVLKPAVLTF